MAIMEGAEPFLLPGGERGILLIHGFTGSPSEMRLLGEYLNGQGYTVLAPRLRGHGTSVEEMEKTDWFHWYSAVEDGYHILKALCREISVVGLSLGGLLSLKISAEYPVCKIVSLSAPIYITDKRLWMLPLYRMFQKYVPKRRRRFSDIDPKFSIAYNHTPLSSLTSLLELIKHVEELIPTLSQPVLIMQSRAEHTVRPESAQYIYDHVGSRDKKLIWLDKSGHVITLDVERDKVFREVTAFLA